MRLKPFFSYYGSKWTIIDKYPKPNTDTIIEPFAGSAQYATRYPSKKVILYDLDENIYQIWRYLISVSEKEIMDMNLSFDHIEESKLIQEQKILVGFWIAQGGATPAKTRTKRSIENGILWKERICSQLKHIRHWEVYNTSYEQIEDHNASWFIDPPYKEKGYRYKKSSKDINYSHLSQWCKERKKEYIVCENNGADWMQFKDLCNLKNMRNVQTREVYCTNIIEKQLYLW